ncbi:MAG: peptidylprolyl isomerase, partial [Pirellulaceae bacterium]
LNQQRALYVRQLLPRKIELKLILLDFYRTIPEDKLDEALANIDEQVGEQFYQEQVPRLKKQLNVDSLRELDSKLRSFGTSIDMQKTSFREQVIAQTTIGQNVEQTPEVTHDELLDYYHEHIEDYKITAQAKWEKLTVRFDNFPSKSEADRALVEMGNQVLRGADFATVAKKYSQGTNAWKGGYHDWTPRGSLVSEVLDEAIFTLPLNRLSKKLEDERGLHIVRVLERREAGRVPFKEAQDEIREKLQDKHREQQTREYLEELREKTYIRTIFDDVSGVDAARDPDTGSPMGQFGANTIPCHETVAVRGCRYTAWTRKARMDATRLSRGGSRSPLQTGQTHHSWPS